MIRPCSICGVADDGPRHVFGIFQPLPGQETEYRHPECCATTGCEICIETVSHQGETING